MKQRLGIAAALLPQPELLILDEPTNGLDPAGIAEMRRLLAAFAAEGMTVLVSSHLLAEIEQACDHLVMIREGRLVFQGTVEELVRRHQAELRARPESTARSPAGWPHSSATAASRPGSTTGCRPRSTSPPALSPPPT